MEPRPADHEPGDERAIDVLVAEHLPRIRSFVRLNINGFLRARESCSDVVQSVCTDLLRAADRLDYRDEQSFRNWLYTAVLNKLRDHERYFRAEKRDPRRERSHDDPEDAAALAGCYASVGTPSHHAVVRERIDSLERAFDQLPDSYRKVITLARIVELPHAQIAASMDKSEGAVRMLLSRALVQLSAVMEKLEGESSA